MKKTLQKYKRYGQSLSEYSIVIILLVVVLGTGFFLIGDKLTELFLGVKLRTFEPPKPIGQTAASLLQKTPVEIPIPSPPENNSPKIEKVTATLKLADGNEIPLFTPTDIASSVDTVGANGTTALLADSLSSLGKQLLASGKIDQTTENIFEQLANQGHRIATIENIMEAQAATCARDVQCLQTTPVQFEGKTYNNVEELSSIITASGQDSSGNYIFGSEIGKFWDLRTALWPSGIMDDPALKPVIDYHVQAIHNIADDTRVVAYNMFNHGVGTPADFQTLAAQKSTNSNSASICNIGGGNDTGIKCP